MHTDVLESTTKVNKKVSTPRIAIIGGGIAGVTVASALVSRLQDENRKTQVILFEQDSEGGQRNVAFDDCQQPVWTAGKYNCCSTDYEFSKFILNGTVAVIIYVSFSDSAKCQQYGAWCCNACNVTA